MEAETKYGNAPPLPIAIGQPSNGLKLEVIDHDHFCISSPQTFLQDFYHVPSIKASSSFNPDIDTVLDPFLHGFDLYEDNKLAYYYDGNGIANAMQSFQGGGGFFNFANRKDLFMEIDLHPNPNPNPLSIHESSCVTADPFQKEINRGGADETKVGRRKAKSGKGQWTTEEDR